MLLWGFFNIKSLFFKKNWDSFKIFCTTRKKKKPYAWNRIQMNLKIVEAFSGSGWKADVCLCLLPVFHNTLIEILTNRCKIEKK